MRFSTVFITFIGVFGSQTAPFKDV